MKSSIFIRTSPHDVARWIPWTLRFLKLNWKPEFELVISSDNSESETLLKMQDSIEQTIHLAPFDPWQNGWIHQQYVKHHADNYCTGEYITFLDADCMLVMPTDFETNLMVDGKPLIWFTEFERIHAPWRYLMYQILCWEPKFEFMRCFPITYHRSTLKDCREHLERLHGMSLNDFMRRARTWTEFNILGFFAYVRQRPLYAWINTYEHPNFEHEIHRHDRVRQFHNVYDWNDGTIPYLSDLYDQAYLYDQAVKALALKEPPIKSAVNANG